MLAYYSQTLKRAECQYCVTRKKLLAAVKRIHQFHMDMISLYAQTMCAFKWLLNICYPDDRSQGGSSSYRNITSKYSIILMKVTSVLTFSYHPCLNQSCRLCDRMEFEEHESLQLKFNGLRSHSPELVPCARSQSRLCPIHATRMIVGIWSRNVYSRNVCSTGTGPRH